MEREFRIEITYQYNEDNPVYFDQIVSAIYECIGKISSHVPNVNVTDEAITNNKTQMYCPHCDGVISGVIFK